MDSATQSRVTCPSPWCRLRGQKKFSVKTSQRIVRVSQPCFSLRLPYYVTDARSAPSYAQEGPHHDLSSANSAFAVAPAPILSIPFALLRSRDPFLGTSPCRPPPGSLPRPPHPPPPPPDRNLHAPIPIPPPPLTQSCA